MHNIVVPAATQPAATKVRDVQRIHTATAQTQHLTGVTPRMMVAKCCKKHLGPSHAQSPGSLEQW
jgi:hypothetical protein